MFQRILVPLDDGMRVQVAMRIAATIARRASAQLVLVQTEPNAPGRTAVEQ